MVAASLALVITQTDMNNMRSPFSASGDCESPRNGRPFFHFWRCFWLTFLVVSLPVAWYCYYVPSNRIAWAESYAVAQTQAIQSEKPVILYFTGKWCVPCRIMKRNVWADEQVMASVNSQFVPVAIDVDDPDDAAVMARYKVEGPPVTIITDSRGSVLRWRAGGIGKIEFLEFLAESNSS